LQKENFEEQSGSVINHSMETEWSQVLSHYNIQNITFEDFIECDDNVLVTELLLSKRKWIEIDRNGFVLFMSNLDSDLLNSFLSN